MDGSDVEPDKWLHESVARLWPMLCRTNHDAVPEVVSQRLQPHVASGRPRRSPSLEAAETDLRQQHVRSVSCRRARGIHRTRVRRDATNATAHVSDSDETRSALGKSGEPA